jgi:large subunit ribosomal protein L32
MANPKRRHSKTRQAKRRANWKISCANLSVCPQCSTPKLPHRICPSCGYYKGKPVVVMADKEKDKESKKKKR